MHYATEFALAVESDAYPKTDFSQLQFRGKLDTQAFVQAFNEIIPSMPIAQSVIEQRREGAHYKTYWIHQLDRPNHLHVEDCRHMVKRPLDPVAFISDYHATRSMKRLNLFEEYPIQFFLLRIADDVHLFSMVYHHVAVDAASGYAVIKDILVRYHEKVTGKAPAWSQAPSITSAVVRSGKVAQSQPAMEFIKEQLGDLFFGSRGKVSQIASKEIRNVLGRRAYRASFGDPEFMAGAKAVAKHNEATLGDVFAATISRTIAAWDRDYGLDKDKIRALLAANIRNRMPKFEGGVALSGLMININSPDRLDLDTVVRHFRDNRIDQMNRGVDIAYHNMLTTLAKSMRWLPLNVRGKFASGFLSIPVTFILSNMGVMWPEIKNGKPTGRSAFTRVGGFEIDDVHSSVSLSPDVGMGMMCRTLGDKFFINFCFDRLRFNRQEAVELFGRLSGGLEELSEHAPRKRRAV